MIQLLLKKKSRQQKDPTHGKRRLSQNNIKQNTHFIKQWLQLATKMCEFVGTSDSMAQNWQKNKI